MDSNTAHKNGRRYEAVAMGVSAGGLNALEIILGSLDKKNNLSIIIVQHIPPGAGDFLVQFLNEKSFLPVKQADEKEAIQSGHIYIAPADYHLLVEEDKTFSLTVDEKVNYARPSIDLLFETAAFAYGAGLIGVILTGANKDGSQGLKTIKDTGGLTIVQDPDTAEVSTMPKEAIAAHTVDHILPIEKIASFLNILSINSIKKGD